MVQCFFHLPENNKKIAKSNCKNYDVLRNFAFYYVIIIFFRIEEVKKRKWAKIDEYGIK